MATRLALEAGTLAGVNMQLAVLGALASDFNADTADVLAGGLRAAMRNNPAACAAVECMSSCGVLEPRAFGCVFQGLRIAVPILVRLAGARAPPQAAREVLQLWLQEAGPAFRLDQPPGAVLGPATHSDTPAQGFGAGHGSSTDASLALSRELFSADVRASMHGATCEARHVVYKALAAVVELLRDLESWFEDTMLAP